VVCSGGRGCCLALYELQELDFHPLWGGEGGVSEVGRTQRMPPEKVDRLANVAGAWMADTALSSARLISLEIHRLAKTNEPQA